jgi:coenzyme F420-reducing hydrogenase gamma subunit
MAKKLRVGLFSFSCCEDSSIIFVEMMNDHWKEWAKLIDFKYARILQTKNSMEEMDVAIIEGAIANEKDKAKVLEIRKLAKKVVAIGSCACSGLPAGQRNLFNEETKKEIQFIVDKIGMSEKVLSIPQIITVEDMVVGCPMDENKFLEVLNKYLMEFEIIPKA